MCRPAVEDHVEIDQEQYLEKLLQTVYKDKKSLLLTCLFVSSAGLLSSMNIFSYQFVGKTPEDYWCYVDGLSNTSWSQEQIKEIAIPKTTTNGIEAYSKCDIYLRDYELLSAMTFAEAQLYANTEGSNRTTECTRRYFDGDVNSFVTKWDLVCDRRSLYATAQSAIQSGFVIDSFIFGYLTDRYGRRQIFLLSFGLSVFCGMALIVVPYLWLFILLRMCLSTFSFAAITAGIVLCLEKCSVKCRSLIGPCFSLPWAVGIMIIPLVAYYIRTWYYIQLIITLPFVFIFFGGWLSGIVTESPRWLILNKQYDLAYDIIKKSADHNDHELPYREIMIKEMQKISIQTGNEVEENLWQSILTSCLTILSFFTRKDLRIRTLVVFFVWFSSSMVYYGVGLGADAISTNEYMFMFFGGLVEFFALLSLWPYTAYFGRKYPLLSYFVISAASILAVAGLQYSLQESELEWLRVVLYLTGKFTIAAAFQLIWVYTSELYPTNLRCLASGGGSTVAKLGSFFSPFINDILGQKILWAPAATFGAFSLLSASSVLFLPETVEEYLLEDLTSPKIQEDGNVNESAEVERV